MSSITEIKDEAEEQPADTQQAAVELEELRSADEEQVEEGKTLDELDIDEEELAAAQAPEPPKGKLAELLKNFNKGKYQKGDYRRTFEDRNKFLELLTPSYMKTYFDHVEIDEVKHKILIAAGYPRTVRDGWLRRITGAKGAIDVSMFINPLKMETVISMLEQDKNKILRDIAADEAKGRLISDSITIRLDDTTGMIRELEEGNTKAYEFSMYFDVRADDTYKLKVSTKEAEANMNSMRIQHKQATKKHHEGLHAILPFCTDPLEVTQIVPTQIIAANFPFVTYNLPPGRVTGVLQGYNLENGLPVIVDRRMLSNRSKLVIAGSGAGKSYHEKIDLSWEIEQGTECYIIDPNDEYGDLVEQYGGQLITLGMDAESSINIFDLNTGDGEPNLFDKFMELDPLWPLLFGGESGMALTPPQIDVMEKGVRAMYERKGITLENPESWKKGPLDMPILSDLYDVLRETAEQTKKEKDPSSVTATTLVRRLARYVEGPLQFMNRHTNVDLEKQVVVFNYYKMPKTVKPVASYIISKFIMGKMDPKKKHISKRVVIDEAGAMLKNEAVANDVFDMATQGRKFGLGLDLLVQNPEFLPNNVRAAILSNISMVVLLPIPAQVVDDIGNMFKLTPDERKLITAKRDESGRVANQGEGFVIVEGTRIPFKVRTSDKMHELITTNPEEIRERRELKNNEQKGK